MNPAELIALGEAVLKLAEEAPEIVSAVFSLTHAVLTKSNPTPAMKHLTAVAEAKALGLDPSKV